MVKRKTSVLTPVMISIAALCAIGVLSHLKMTEGAIGVAIIGFIMVLVHSKRGGNSS